MLFLRVFGKTLLFIAFVALAYDCVRILASPGGGLLLTSLSTHLNDYAPGGREGMQSFFLAHSQSYFWTDFVKPALDLPFSILCGIFGTLIFLAGYRRPPPEIVDEEHCWGSDNRDAGQNRRHGLAPETLALSIKGMIFRATMSPVKGPGKR